ncbi:MAG: D-alanyl-D-alanine carboxypeptidase [Pseudomonadales bacterium]
MMRPIRAVLFIALSTFFCSLHVAAASKSSLDALDKYLQDLRQDDLSSFLAQPSEPSKNIAIRSETARVPASTLKLATAYLALKRWGEKHRFHTDFFVSGNTLWVKGYGDPFITSQEIARMARALRPKLKGVKRIALDNTYFPELSLDGRGNSSNPYDASNAALVANFNTMNIVRSPDGVFSAEPQTPLTPLSIKQANKGPFGKRRIALPGGRDYSARYFGELLSQALFGGQVKIRLAPVPAKTTLLYRHKSSQELLQVVQSMLRYSNNFIANQLFLLLPEGIEQVDPVLAQQWYKDKLVEEFKWTGVNFADGAGLSRKNSISAVQLAQLLDAFRPWMDLLPSQVGGVKAKTGTLSDNHSYAGYYREGKQWRSFVLLVNQKMPYNYRFNLARALVKAK